MNTILGNYIFTAMPWVEYVATLGKNGVDLQYFFATIHLSIKEFDGLLCIGKLDRVFN